MPRIVLVADDSPTIQKRALGILKAEGFDVETVSNGVAAIKRLALLHPVVILADVSMPGRDGYEVCEFVKKSEEFSRVPVLLVASDMEPYDDARGAEVRADGIIKKPFDAHELSSLVVKFAAQFEAETPAVAEPVAAPEAPDPTREFVPASISPDHIPTSVEHSEPVHPPDHAIANESSEHAPIPDQHPPQNFAEVSEGVAFTEHAAAETSEYFSGPPVAGVETSHSMLPTEADTVFNLELPQDSIDTFPGVHAASIGEAPLVGGEAPTPSPDARPDVLSPERTPSFLEGMEAVTSEPVFIQDTSGQTGEPPHPTPEFHTEIFRTPLEIAEPSWKDETFSPSLEPASSASTREESRPEVAAPIVSPEETKHQPLEPLAAILSISSTSLDSFSLGDATAGQVHFAEAAADPIAEALHSPVASEEITPAAVPAEYPFVEAASGEAQPSEAALPVAPAEEAPVEAAAGEAAGDDVASAVAPTELAGAEPAPIGEASGEVTSEVAPAEYPFVQAASEEKAGDEVASGAAPPEPVALGGAAGEVAAEGVAHLAQLAEAQPVEAATPEREPEVIAPEANSTAAELPVGSPENTAEASAPPPAFDWAMFYSIVHKVVVKMSPPPLPAEAVEEMTRRLAEEIATEMISESSRPVE
ncbi:MAG: response regulator [Terriglobia bacterium]